MKPLIQTRTGLQGNCFSTALASILETQVPEFGMNVSDAEFFRNADAWLAERGYRYEEIPATGKPPKGYHLILGISPRGGRHAVVGKDGKIVHDPHPEDGTGRGIASRDAFGILLPVRERVNDEYQIPTAYKHLEIPEQYHSGLCPACGQDAPLGVGGIVEQHGDCPGWGMPGLLEDCAVAADESAFKKLQGKLESEGKSKEQAGGIAYKIGAEKYGKEGMAKKAAAGRKK